jgi:hypothetical protein
MLKRLFTSRFAIPVVAVLSLLIGFGVGYRAGAAAVDEAAHSSALAQSTLELMKTTALARALRDGQVEPARARLETNLDQAIIDIGHHYTPARDSDGRAVRALREARAYREAHPERFEHSPLAEFVEPALATLPK